MKTLSYSFKHILSLLFILLMSFSYLNADYYYITSDNSDAEERVSNGDMYLDSSDLEMAWDDHLQIVGLRFNAVDIPVGATITSAKIRFRADHSDSSTTPLVISGELSNDAASFSTTDYDLSSRTETAATVTWNPTGWLNNSYYETDDISSVIQEIVNQPGYAGDDLVIFIAPGAGCIDDDCYRRADSRDTSSSAAPRLEIEFSGETPPIMGDITDEVADVNLAYSFDISTFVTLTQGDAITAYTLSGTLPTGLSFDTGTGVISGTPTELGTFNLSASATDNDGESNYDNFALTVISQEPPIMGDITDKPATNGSSFSFDISTFVTITNGDPVTSYAIIGTLPTGLSFNTTTGVISGTPTVNGTYPLQASATDNDGESNYDNFIITVSDTLICQNYDINSASNSYIDIEDLTDPNGADYNTTLTAVHNDGDIITSMNNIDANTTACIYGDSPPGDYDYYYFKVLADGNLNIVGTSPNSHVYGLKITSDNGYSYGTEIEENHNLNVGLRAGDSIYIRVHEDGSDTDEYELTFNFTIGGYIAGDREFLIRNPLNTRNIRGNYEVGGNVNLCRYVLDDNNYPWGIKGFDVNNDGISDNCKTVQDNSNSDPASFVDIDGDSSTINSSSFNLDLPDNSEVVWAGLYWQGVVHNTIVARDFMDGTLDVVDAEQLSSNKGINLAANNNGYGTYGAEKVKFKIPGGSYQEITAEVLDFDDLGYAGFQEVTTLVRGQDISVPCDSTNPCRDPDGVYTVADIKSHQGIESNHGNYAAWVLVVIYENADEEFRNISLFDGFATVNTSFSEDLVIDGFLTPKSGDIESKLAFFTMDGDDGSNYMHIINQAGTVTNVEDGLGGSLFNSSIIIPDAANRIPQNPSLRMDLDIIELENVLDNLDTTVTLRPRTGGDRYTASFFIMSSDLYAPKLCYDYSYSQYGRYITEENNGTRAPRLDPRNDQSVTVHEPITLKLFVRNEEASDTIATDVTLNLLDIGDCSGTDCQAEYTLNTTYVSPVDSSILAHQPDVNANARDVRDVAIDDISSESYFYSSFIIDPLVSDINMSINARLDYSLQLFDNNGDPLLPEPLNYKQYLDSKIPLCNAGAFLYNPEKDIFNIVHDHYYTSYPEGDIGGTYNLPTQVVERDGNFHIIATDANTSISDNENMDLLKSTTAIVGVEIIDAGGWQDAETSCTEDDTRRSHIVWVGFDDNVTNAPLNNAVLSGTDTTHYIFTEHPDEGTEKDIPLFSAAIESAAFRITYFGTNNGVNPDFRKGSVEGWYLENFTEYAGTECPNDPDLTNPPTAIEVVSEHCGDNSGRGIADFDMCIKCLMGSTIKRVCSRDNFAIRPEAFMIKMQDTNTTNAVTVLDPNLTGVVSVVSPIPTADLAAGYDYELNVTAVTHDNNDGSYKYINSFPDTSDETGGFIYTWIPTADDTKCNDLNNSDIAFSFSGNTGKGSVDSHLNQVGTYTLSMLDKTWTLVDQNPSHHIVADNFTTGTASVYDDCVKDVSTVSIQSSSNLSGCDISSTHTSSEAGGLSYQDPKIEFHPYTFAVDTNFTIGLANVTPPTSKPFIYMEDINSTENMSVHLNTTITAAGKNNAALSNFVTGCYSKALNLSIGKSATTNTALSYKYAFHNRDLANNVISAHDINTTIAAGDLTTIPRISTLSTFFQKDQNGTIDTVTNLNFNRAKNIIANPEDITFITYSADDNLTQFNADLVSNKTAVGSESLNQNIIHYYGRTHASRQRYEVPTDDPYRANIYYETYCFQTTNGNTCNPLLLQSTQRTDDLRWFINTSHNAGFGNAGTVVEKDGLTNVTGSPTTGGIIQDFSNLTYSHTSGTNYYPYKTTMENNASGWLIYNEDDAGAVTNSFPVEFEQAGGGWSGEHETDTTTDDPGTAKINRRSMW